MESSILSEFFIFIGIFYNKKVYNIYKRTYVCYYLYYKLLKVVRKLNSKRIIFHIDVNSAYLSWSAASMLNMGKSNIDIRKIPSVIGGSIAERHGIVLAKSIPAKKYNIKTGEPIVSALTKCPNLQVYPPDYNLYMRCSNSMYELLLEYSPLIQRYSVDEVFMDVSHFKEDYMVKASEIKDRIEKELGFTVNIGISNNKLLAKMASDFPKKNSIHTLFPREIKDKMWPLPVSDLFMVGKATEKKLKKLNISTIGELATYDYGILHSIFKSYATILYNYANGIDYSEVRKRNYIEIKGMGNSTTLTYDCKDREYALKILLSLVESVAMRLRHNGSLCSVIAVSIKNSDFISYSHQKKLKNYIDTTTDIFNVVKKIFDEVWMGESIRQLGVRVTDLCSNEFYQSSFFDDSINKKRALDKAIDSIREKYGNEAIIRSTFINSNVKPLCGGVGESDYPMMGSVL